MSQVTPCYLHDLRYIYIYIYIYMCVCVCVHIVCGGVILTYTLFEYLGTNVYSVIISIESIKIMELCKVRISVV